MDLDTEINAGDEDILGTDLGVGVGDGTDLGGGAGDLGGAVGVVDDLETITPKVGLEFSSQDDAYKFYNRYALKMGFGIKKSSTNSSRSDRTLIISRKYLCRKQGISKSSKKGIVDEDVGNRREIVVDCKAMMKVVLTESGSWRVSKFLDEHSNHEMSTPSKVVKHWSHKRAHRLPVVKDLMTQYHGEGIANATIARIVNSYEPDEAYRITPQQVHDHLRIQRKSNLGKNCKQVVKHFIEKQAKDPLFYSSFEVDDEMTLRSVFWADGRSQEAYKQFSDVIIFDVTYRTNNLCLPFAPFTGINHHRQSSLFGCALLADETEQTFVWLFQQWLTCMGGKAPGAIITDQDAAIGNAIAIVFPNTIHRYCDTIQMGLWFPEGSTSRLVSYNSDGVVVSCDCKHFEYVGLLCRHILCVFWKKQVQEIPERYILKRWTLAARYRPVAVDRDNDVRGSEVDRDRHWAIRYQCNKAVELAYNSPNFSAELDRFLMRKFAEYDASSQVLNSQVEPIAPYCSQSSSNLGPLINIRDPTGPARHKGRPRSVSRVLSGLEESQEEAAKKRRTCGYCGEKGHYRTGCSKAKESNVAPGGSQAL